MATDMSDDVVFRISCSLVACRKVDLIFAEYGIVDSDIIKKDDPRGYSAIARNMSILDAVKIRTRLSKIAGIYKAEVYPVIAVS